MKMVRARATPYFFISPFFLLFAIFFAFPLAYSLYLSLTTYDGMSAPQFVGVSNYTSVFNDPRFWTALLNTFDYTVVYNAIMLSLALVVAAVLSSGRIRFAGLFRTAYFAPVTVSLVVTALIFGLILGRSYGLVNNVLRTLGIAANYGWLDDPELALLSIILMRVWRATGYYAIFLIAGLQAIPEDMYDAAKTDGARPLQIFWRITLPLLSPVLLFTTMMSTLWSIQLFDEPWILTKGGPLDSTLTVSVYLYQHAFQYLELGYGSAIAYILAGITIALSLIQMKLYLRG